VEVVVVVEVVKVIKVVVVVIVVVVESGKVIDCLNVIKPKG